MLQLAFRNMRRSRCVRRVAVGSGKAGRAL